MELVALMSAALVASLCAAFLPRPQPKLVAVHGQRRHR